MKNVLKGSMQCHMKLCREQGEERESERASVRKMEDKKKKERDRASERIRINRFFSSKFYVFCLPAKCKTYVATAGKKKEGKN